MKRLALVACLCVLVGCQYSWGSQQPCVERPQGLVEVLTDIVLAPCGLLTMCLGLDTPANKGPHPCCVSYPPPRKCPDRILRGDSSTRIKQTREQTGSPAPEKTLPEVKRQKRSTDEATTQAAPTPPKIQPGPQPPAVSGPAKPLPPAIPRNEEPVASPGGPLPSRDQVKGATPEERQKNIEPQVTPPAAPPGVKDQLPPPVLPGIEPVKPVPGQTAPPMPLAAPKTDEFKKPEKSRPKTKTPCGPVFYPGYPGCYYR